jgi:hypothetical protein
MLLLLFRVEAAGEPPALIMVLVPRVVVVAAAQVTGRGMALPGSVVRTRNLSPNLLFPDPLLLLLSLSLRSLLRSLPSLAYDVCLCVSVCVLGD